MNDSNAHRTDDELLRALVVGDVTEHDSDVIDRLARNSELAARWRELSATIDDVSLLRELKSDLAGHDEDPQFDSAAVVQKFRSGQKADDAGWRRVVAIAVAVAATVLITVWGLGLLDGTKSNPQLGEGAIEMSHDGVALTVDTALTWGAAPGAVFYRVEVQDTARAVASTTTEALEQPRWPLTPTEHSRLPPQFRWRVISYDGSGELLGMSRWAVSSRR